MHIELTKKLLTKEMLTEVGKLFGIEASTIEHVGGFENIIYQGMIGQRPVVMRISNNLHRSEAQLYSELHWVEYLKDRGANVCGPFKSHTGNLVETIQVEDTYLFFSVFEKAPGKMIDIRTERHNTKLFEGWGRATGKLHRLTQDYQRPAGLVSREDNVDLFDKTFALTIPQEPNLLTRVGEITAYIRSLPNTPDWYGLIHSDIHAYNFFYHEEELYIFDFDDCCYFPFASDIAIPLYYTTWARDLTTQEARDEFGNRFIRSFLTGYLEEHPLTKEQLYTIPQLLLFRDCELLGLLIAELGSNMTESEVALIEAMKNRILNNQPIANIDYAKLVQELPLG